MKKLIRQFVILIILIIIFFILRFTNIRPDLYIKSFFLKQSYKNKYYSREIFNDNVTYNLENDFFEDTGITENNFSIKLSDIDYNQTEGNTLNFRFKVYTNEKLANLGCVLKVYDDTKEYCNMHCGGAPLLDEYAFPYYANFFAKDAFNYTGTSREYRLTLDDKNVFFDYDSEEIVIQLDLEDNYAIPSNINVDFLDLQYHTVGNKDYVKVIEPLGEIQYNIKFDK